MGFLDTIKKMFGGKEEPAASDQAPQENTGQETGYNEEPMSQEAPAEEEKVQ